MDRLITYAGSVPLDTDLLNTNRNTLVALAKLAGVMLGTATIVNGLAAVPTVPAGLTINVNPGELYSQVNLDGTAYGSLAADTTHQVVKQGILLDAVNLNCPAPAIGGQSINYLIQAAYQDSDSGTVVLPYYNASNPTQAWSGPNNSGTAQATARKGVVTLSAKTGVAATTGTQTTPAPDAGYTGLWVVTVANGQSTITTGNISQYTGAPILQASLLQSILQASGYAVESGSTVNTYVVTPAGPAPQTLADGLEVSFYTTRANTGASTLNAWGFGAKPLNGMAGALQGGEITSGFYRAKYSTATGGFALMAEGAGALQVGPATKSQHAMQLGQATGRLLNIQVFTASGTYNATAGTITGIVEVIGGGGGSGGSSATGAGTISVTGGGGAGAYARTRLTTGFSGTAVTVGAGGTAGAAGGGTGGTGGTSSFGAFVSCVGGVGSNGRGAFAPSGLAVGGGGAAAPVGANIVNSRGSDGAPALTISNTDFISGVGANTPFGAGGTALSATGAGNNGVSYGSGAGGACTAISATAQAGGAGAPGVVIVYEYA